MLLLFLWTLDVTIDTHSSLSSGTAQLLHLSNSKKTNFLLSCVCVCVVLVLPTSLNCHMSKLHPVCFCSFFGLWMLQLTLIPPCLQVLLNFYIFQTVKKQTSSSHVCVCVVLVLPTSLNCHMSKLHPVCFCSFFGLWMLQLTLIPPCLQVLLNFYIFQTVKKQTSSSHVCVCVVLVLPTSLNCHMSKLHPVCFCSFFGLWMLQLTLIPPCLQVLLNFYIFQTVKKQTSSSHVCVCVVLVLPTSLNCHMSKLHPVCFCSFFGLWMLQLTLIPPCLQVLLNFYIFQTVKKQTSSSHVCVCVVLVLPTSLNCHMSKLHPVCFCSFFGLWMLQLTLIPPCLQVLLNFYIFQTVKKQTSSSHVCVCVVLVLPTSLNCHMSKLHPVCFCSFFGLWMLQLTLIPPCLQVLLNFYIFQTVKKQTSSSHVCACVWFSSFLPL